MADEKQSKKELKRKARRLRREQEAAEWDKHMVLEPAQLKNLLDFLDGRLGEERCEHSLRFDRRLGRSGRCRMGASRGIGSALRGRLRLRGAR